MSMRVLEAHDTSSLEDSRDHTVEVRGKIVSVQASTTIIAMSNVMYGHMSMHSNMREKNQA